MKTRLALPLIAGLSLILTLAPGYASSDDAVRLEPSAQEFAVGAEAMFHVIVPRGGASTAEFEYSVEGGTITGALSINETEDGDAKGAVFVRREAAGAATLIASKDGTELSRATANFVHGSPVTVEVSLAAGPSAAARTWFFEVVDVTGEERAFVHVATSGDNPKQAVASQPLPHGDYTVRLAASRDTAGDCSGSALFSLTPQEAHVTVSDVGSPLASFEVRLCQSASASQDSPAATAGVIDEVAGARSTSDPLPPDTGSGSSERPRLTDKQIHQLASLAFGLAILFGIGIYLTRFLAKVAPLKTPERKK